MIWGTGPTGDDFKQVTKVKGGNITLLRALRQLELLTHDVH